jgi:hypothetical protein
MTAQFDHMEDIACGDFRLTRTPGRLALSTVNSMPPGTKRWGLDLAKDYSPLVDEREPTPRDAEL